MSSKKALRRLKDILLTVDVVFLIAAIALGAYCGWKYYQIYQIENNGFEEAMAQLDQQELQLQKQISEKQAEIDVLVRELENVYAQAKTQRDQVQNTLYDTLASRDDMNKQVAEVQEQIGQISNMEQSIADIRTEYGLACRELEDMILAGESKYRICYLTFDDGPSYLTEKFLEELKRLDVYATFFTIGVGVQSGSYALRDEMLREEAKGGHTIANHTYSHAFDSGLYSSVDSFMSSVQKQDDLVYEVTGIHTDIVRFPAGSYYCRYRKQSIEALTEAGYGWIDWLGNAYDSGGYNYSAAHTSSTVIWQARQEKIYVVLMHDWVNNTLYSLKSIVTTLRKDNYVFLPLFKESSTIGNVYPRWDN